MAIFETHAHYDDERFDEDRVELLSHMPKCGIGTIINVGAALKGAKDSVTLAHTYPHVYAAIGVHPSEVEDLEDDGQTADGDDVQIAKTPDSSGFMWLRENSTDKRVVAIGEIGLDYYWDKELAIQKRQQYWFSRQIDLAGEAGLPVIIHSRDACEDTLKEMRRAAELGVRGVIHCFSYAREVAEEYVKMGYYIGIGGVVTFKNGRKMKEVAASVPLERILIETDSPYLAPEPFRGTRNDSTYLPYVVKEIAKLREITEDEVIEVTTKNARELFSKVR